MKINLRRHRFGGGMGGARAEWRTTKLKKLTAIILAAVVSASMAACGSGSPRAVPTITPTVTTPTPTVPAWEAKFTAAQISDYNAALAAYKRLQVREAPIWANPTRYTSAQAQAIFNADWLTPSVPMYRYRTYLDNHIRVIGIPRVLSSELSSSKSDSATGLEVISIRQCVDGSATKGLQNGKPLPTTSHERGYRTVRLYKTRSGEYLMGSAEGGQGSC
jgi:hypothetical protein